jgi:hypothetical protein
LLQVLLEFGKAQLLGCYRISVLFGRSWFELIRRHDSYTSYNLQAEADTISDILSTNSACLKNGKDLIRILQLRNKQHLGYKINSRLGGIKYAVAKNDSQQSAELLSCV